MRSEDRTDPTGRVPGLVLGAARERGPLRVSDFPALEAAAGYANDAASESDAPPPLAYVFDDGLECVGRGRHYAS